MLTQGKVQQVEAKQQVQRDCIQTTRQTIICLCIYTSDIYSAALWGLWGTVVEGRTNGKGSIRIWANSIFILERNLLSLG